MFNLKLLLAVIVGFLPLFFDAAVAGHQPSIHGFSYNNCGFDVWARQAVAANASSRSWEKCPNGNQKTPMVRVPTQSVHVTPIPITKHSCSHSSMLLRTSIHVNKRAGSLNSAQLGRLDLSQ
ncbi:hypothetical protein EJ02DRAFT_426003 [Clathrospora elynae]|uniref:Uncharacterized protein n=1 Tax=Clathrospora elynae TaxID=706981 RepID=A0A6A5SHZ2_9PLEO|nr:hypothetical protein EJ02DRAFT_426003 [Clathrospora elynae]